MDVTLQYFEGCPNWRTTADNLRTALNQVDAADLQVRRQLVESVDDAERLGFLGSPTVLIDGIDPFAEPGGTPSLSCRVYRTEHGLAGSPTMAQLLSALMGRPDEK